MYAKAETTKFIHLLYSPTNFCNMACQYCYLGTGTDQPTNTKMALDTLHRAINSFLAEDITPFNLSFHGGEPTAIPKDLLRSLLEYATNYYAKHSDKIKAAGYPINPVHIKTNLYNFDKLYKLFDEFKVSISGSVDLPLALHEKYRVDKKDQSTLKKITKNLELLAQYPHHKKISCVITQEHMNHLDELIADINTLHYELGLDMSKFNIMFSFDSIRNQEKYSHQIAGTEMLNERQQLEFYNTLKNAFMGTDLEYGLKHHWFKEFTPEFCCSAINCGDKFFLLQSNGDVYSCPRGQSSAYFRYGNIYENSIDEIVTNGWQTIESIENTLETDDACYRCNYLPYCNQGCVFVREQTGLTKSYTCQLQKAIYQDQPEKYPAFSDDYIQVYAASYRFRNNLKSVKHADLAPSKSQYITPELMEDKNSLASLINQDRILSEVYSNDNFSLEIDNQHYTLASPILNNMNELALIGSASKIYLRIRAEVFEINCKDPVNNSIHLMLLRNTLVSYGDEARQKQEHLVDYSIYQNSFISLSEEKNTEYLKFDLSPFFHSHASLFLHDIRNNLYVTTKSLREYHYQKQKKNAFYHIQAINLPFPFLEFYWSR